MGGEGHSFDMINRMRENQRLLRSRREQVRDLKKNYLAKETTKTSSHEIPDNLREIKEKIQQELHQKRKRALIITGGVMIILLIVIIYLIIKLPLQNFSSTFFN